MPEFTVEMPISLPVERQGDAWLFSSTTQSVRLTNLSKVFWPSEGYTKGDLLNWYFNVGELIVPHLMGRPLTLKRMPDGATGKFFYEKNAPTHTPDWIPRCLVEADKPIDFLMVDDIASLLFVVNLGCIEFHPLHSRCDDLEHPDYLFFDLDPFEPAGFEEVSQVALHIKAALDSLDLPSYPKTSGATGMQIFVPIVREYTYEAIRGFVETVGRAVLDVDPSVTTMEWDTTKRAGKVFIDHNMNRSGANIASVYCVRPEVGATVSMPITWDEIADGVHPSQFTIQTSHKRLAQGDLFEGVLTNPVRLPKSVPQDSRRPTKPPSLETYKQKRDFDATPEPAETQASSRDTYISSQGLMFVIQKHSARRLHYDLRLEKDGVLASWALPKGLPTRRGERRLAVPTEDHPISYATFEGSIPAGNYGAGTVEIFDSGSYDALEWTDTKLTFRLRGRRYVNTFHMFKTNQGWLVALASEGTEMSAPPLLPMLASTVDAPFDDAEWSFEPKLDGVRTLAYVTPSDVKLISRSGEDHTSSWPQLAKLVENVSAVTAIVDGVIASTPVSFYGFDLLWLDGEDTCVKTFDERRALLEQTFKESEIARLTLMEQGEGKAMFEACTAASMDGVIAKKRDSIYRPGQRSADWLAITLSGQHRGAQNA